MEENEKKEEKIEKAEEKETSPVMDFENTEEYPARF